MAATAFHDPANHHRTERESATPRNRRGLFRRLVESLVDGRAKQAQMEVNAYLMTLDDETLKKYGIDRLSGVSLMAGQRRF